MNLMHYFRAFYGIVWRELLRFLQQRERFFAALVRPLIWLIIFAAGFRAALDRPRPEGAKVPIGIFSCSKATNEVNYAAQKFARQVLGSNNIDSCNRT